MIHEVGRKQLVDPIELTSRQDLRYAPTDDILVLIGRHRDASSELLTS